MKIRITLDLAPVEVRALLARFGQAEDSPRAAGLLRQFLTLNAWCDIDKEVIQYLSRLRAERGTA